MGDSQVPSLTGSSRKLSYPYAPCIVYLPTKLGHLWGFYVGKYLIHGAYGVLLQYYPPYHHTKTSIISSHGWLHPRTKHH